MDASENAVIAEYERELDRFLSAFTRANANLAEGSEDDATGVAQQSVVDYDADDDIFMLWLDEPVPAGTVALGDTSVYLRVEPTSLRIVGMEVLNVRAWIAAHQGDAHGFPRQVERFIELYGPGTHTLAMGDAGKFAQGMRELVLA